MRQVKGMGAPAAISYPATSLSLGIIEQLLQAIAQLRG